MKRNADRHADKLPDLDAFPAGTLRKTCFTDAQFMRVVGTPGRENVMLQAT
jgi:hypothetical protein